MVPAMIKPFTLAITHSKNRRDNLSYKSAGVDAAASFGFRAKFRIVKLSEREIGISNWPLNMDVV